MKTEQTLADMRRTAGISQRQVAEALKVSQAQVSRLEARYPEVPFPKLLEYMHVIGVKVVFSGWDHGDVDADRVVSDPSRVATVVGMKNDPTRTAHKN